MRRWTNRDILLNMNERRRIGWSQWVGPVGGANSVSLAECHMATVSFRIEAALKYKPQFR